MSTLTFIPTPIGNIEDITLRSLREIVQAKIIFAEDTRSYLKLRSILVDRFEKIFGPLEIKKSGDQNIYSYREQNHNKMLLTIIDSLKENDAILVTDAVTPGVSDPGFDLIEHVRAAGHEVNVLPGASAVTTALVLSGLPTDKFAFIGFLPRKPKKISNLINDFVERGITLLAFESPFRVKKVVEYLAEMYSDTLEISLVGEISKKFQSVTKLNARDLAILIKDKDFKGEWVIGIRKFKNED